VSKNTLEGTSFLIAEVVFCLAFLSACEIPNWTRGPFSPTECVDRWMFVAGLFFPSSLQNPGIISPRRGRNKT